MTYREKEAKAKILVLARNEKKVQEVLQHNHTGFLATMEEWIDDTETEIELSDTTTEEEDILAISYEIERQVKKCLSVYEEA